MKNTLIQTILAASLSAICFSNSHAAEDEDGKFALGYHFTTESSGLSATMGVSDKVTAQVILGVVGDVSSYSLRGRYHLATDQDWDAYAYASIGAVKWDGNASFDDETVGSIGGGVGMEYNWQNLSANYPPIIWSLEVDMNAADFDNYDFSKFSIGIGAHYRF